MDLTKFNKLKLSVSNLGASPKVTNLNKMLTGRGIPVLGNSEQLVVGDSGIYHVSPDGLLSKTVIHIVDINIHAKYARELNEFVKREDFESEYVLQKIHKYHLLRCKTIERAENEGWRKQKYHMSRRKDGYFYYRFVGNDIVAHEREGQKLYVCKNCLDELTAISNTNYSRETFDLHDFLSSSFNQLMNLERTEKYTHECVPNIYRTDWAKISTAYRDQVKYRCESPNCPAPDLSQPGYKKYLHTHHVSFDKSMNDYSNLQALCIYCHANKSNHANLKNLPDYREYVRLRGLSR